MKKKQKHFFYLPKFKRKNVIILLLQKLNKYKKINISIVNNLFLRHLYI